MLVGLAMRNGRIDIFIPQTSEQLRFWGQEVLDHIIDILEKIAFVRS
jgi:hypothetical protein